jgi:hypothetical protein
MELLSASRSRSAEILPERYRERSREISVLFMKIAKLSGSLVKEVEQSPLNQFKNIDFSPWKGNKGQLDSPAVIS